MSMAERARELAKELVGNVQFYETQEMAFAPGIAAGWPEVIAAPHSGNGRLKRVQTESLTSKIEQALLAERRLAMEEAAKDCLNEASYHANDTKAFGKGAGAAFTKAAERIKKLATPRGGE